MKDKPAGVVEYNLANIASGDTSFFIFLRSYSSSGPTAPDIETA
jgi:hypothetical protein